MLTAQDLKTATIALLCGFIGAYAGSAMATPGGPSKITAASVTVTNSQGKVVAKLDSSADGGPVLMLTSPNGKNTLMIGTDDKGGAIAMTGSSEGRIGVTAPDGSRCGIGPDRLYLGNKDKMLWKAP